ncbi:MAG: putative zinc-binding metallopeptidase [Candidatus Aminicenantes bacterium]|nr:putative zinc-binding metallopeptidase [Candidatus Aminicenantes bacterium]
MTDIQQLLSNKETKKLEVLTTPLNRLGLDLNRSILRPPIDRLLARIRRRGIRLKPHFYLGEDWGSVPGTTNIEIGFYDADPLLKELNKDINGWFNDSRVIDYLLRHETGHIFCYAHRLYTLAEFRRVFGIKGSFFETYPATDRYRPHPWSRDFVNPNRDHYAQKHPDEDFAETFGVWLSLPSDWKKAYKNRRRAVHKLEYVAKLVDRYGDRPPSAPPDYDNLDAPIDSIQATVAEVLGASLRKYRAKATGYIDLLLKKIGRYRTRPIETGMIPLAEVLSTHRKFLMDAMIRNSGVTSAQASSLIGKMATRSAAMHLHIPLARLDKALIDVASLASTLAANYAATGVILP